MVVRAANVVIVVQVSRVIAFNLSLPNKPLHRTRCFLRFSGHPELTVQECRNAEVRT